MDWTVTMAMASGAEVAKSTAPAPRAPVRETQAEPALWQPAEDEQPWQPAAGQVVVGCIPREPPGFQPRAELLAELDRYDALVSVLYAMADRQGAGTTQLAAAYARAGSTSVPTTC